jgi:hypothetical protein
VGSNSKFGVGRSGDGRDAEDKWLKQEGQKDLGDWDTAESGAEMRRKRYPVVIEPTGTGYSAYSADVPEDPQSEYAPMAARRGYRRSLGGFATTNFTRMKRLSFQSK